MSTHARHPCRSRAESNLITWRLFWLARYRQHDGKVQHACESITGEGGRGDREQGVRSGSRLVRRWGDRGWRNVSRFDTGRSKLRVESLGMREKRESGVPLSVGRTLRVGGRLMRPLESAVERGRALERHVTLATGRLVARREIVRPFAFGVEQCLQPRRARGERARLGTGDIEGAGEALELGLVRGAFRLTPGALGRRVSESGLGVLGRGECALELGIAVLEPRDERGTIAFVERYLTLESGELGGQHLASRYAIDELGLACRERCDELATRMGG